MAAQALQPTLSLSSYCDKHLSRRGGAEQIWAYAGEILPFFHKLIAIAHGTVHFYTVVYRETDYCCNPSFLKKCWIL